MFKMFKIIRSILKKERRRRNYVKGVIFRDRWFERNVKERIQIA